MPRQLDVYEKGIYHGSVTIPDTPPPTTGEPPKPTDPVKPPTTPPVTPPGNYQTGSFSHKGNAQRVYLHSGEVICYPIPNDGSSSGKAIMAETSGAPQPRDMEICISRTPGLIDPNGNYAKGDKQLGYDFLNKPVTIGSGDRGGTSTIDGSNAKATWGYGWAPYTEGQWYMNFCMKYDESGGVKPIQVEWNNGPYA